MRHNHISAEAECPNCGHVQACDRDEDGNPCLETQLCHDDDCTVRMCEHCPQFNCDHCGLPHCLSHKVELGGEDFCPLCANVMKGETCECRMSGDQADASDCPAHGGRHAA